MTKSTMHRPAMSPRISTISRRRTALNIQHKRDIYCDNTEFLVYHWSGKSEAFAPATGEQASGTRINIGDHNCRVDTGAPYPFAAEMIPPVPFYKHFAEVLIHTTSRAMDAIFPLSNNKNFPELAL